MWNWLNANSGALGAITAALLICITAYYVYLTWRLLLENQELRQLSNRPEIALTLSLHEAHVNLIFLIIQNIGQGAAHNVRLTTDKPFRTSGSRDLAEIGPFKTGIGLLSPHQKIEVFLANAIDRYDELKTEPLGITAKWKDSSGKSFSRTFAVDFAEYENVSRIGEPPLYSIADSSEKIEKAISRLARGSSKIAVVVQTKEEHRRSNRAGLLMARLSGLSEADFDHVFAEVEAKVSKTEPTSDDNGVEEPEE